MTPLQIGFLVYPGVVQLDVMAGIDFGLTLVGLLCGEDVAKMTQLMMEYHPEPPFNAGIPEIAGSAVVEPLTQLGKPLVDAFLVQTQAIVDMGCVSRKSQEHQ